LLPVLGCRGFIGPYLPKRPLTLGQDVVELDNFAASSRAHGMDCISVRDDYQ
jgi:hypothetical protein